MSEPNRSSPEKISIQGERVEELCYGENRWQSATLYTSDAPPLHSPWFSLSR